MTLYISYTDTDGIKGYKVERAQSDSMVRKPGVLPGMHGMPPVYFDLIDLPMGTQIGERILGRRVLIMTALGVAMKPELRQEIIDGAIDFAQKNAGLHLQKPRQN